MQVIPAIDVLNGKVVRLAQGDFARMTPYSVDPLTLAQSYRRSGATRVHLVNLSAARNGRCDNRFPDLVRVLSRELEVQAGGGIRTLRDIRQLLDAGASAVVIGTLLFRNPAVVRSAVLLFGTQSIIAALDTDGDEVKMMGWLKGTKMNLQSAVRLAQECGIQRVLVTDIRCDGMRSGPNTALYAALRKQFPALRIVASGGVRNGRDINALAAEKLDAVVVGKALLEDPSALARFVAAQRESVSAEDSPSGRCNDLAVRVIPCLDVTQGRVVKGTSFAHLRDAGDPVALARRYCEEGADELVLLDITATSDDRTTVTELVSRVADVVNIPFTIGGGVRSVDDARSLLQAGADKVAVNSAAVRNPDLLEDMAMQLGRANTVCAIDARKCGERWTVLVRGGREDTGKDAVAWAEEAVRRGAGELLVTSFDRDGTGRGFDTDILSRIKERVSVPMIASGGGGTLRSFTDAVRCGGADAVLAASVFHFGTFSVRDVKMALRSFSIPVRL